MDNLIPRSVQDLFLTTATRLAEFSLHSGQWKFLLGIYSAVLLFVSVQPLPKAPGPLLFPYSDKIAHSVEFTIFSFIAFYAMSSDRSPPLRWSISFLLAISYGGLIEGVQHLVPYRSMSAGDWIADLIGAGSAIIIWTVLHAYLNDMRNKMKRKNGNG